MSRTLKWILGIGIALIVVVCIVGIGLLVFSRLNGFGVMMGARAFPQYGYGRNMPMNPYFGMPYRRFGGFFPLRFIGGGIFGLGILVLIVLGIIALVTALRRPPQQAAMQAPAQPAVTAPVQEVPAAQTVVPETAPARSCPSCGRQVNEDWSHCPYCGGPLS